MDTFKSLKMPPLFRTCPIASTMYEDFVLRVRKCRTNPNLSRAIQKCCDYIEMHLEEKIRAKDLADWVGYTEYYLTRKFKDETGFCQRLLKICSH